MSRLKRILFVILLVVIVALLGTIVYSVMIFSGNSSLPPCCPLLPSQVEADQFEPGSRHGFSMMRPGMMNSMNVFINSEYDFLVHMIPHHEEAVATAMYLKENTEREEIKLFAEGIIRTQSAEIEQMTIWLESWYPDRNHQVDYQPMMRDLDTLKGDELDQAFLEDMIPHHMTAIMMSQQLLNRGLAEHEVVNNLARSISSSQRTEIQLMMNWLNNRDGFSPLPAIRNWTTLIWIGVIITIVITLVIMLVIVLKADSISISPTVSEAQECLKIRYAKGEITREEYLSRYKEL